MGVLTISNREFFMPLIAATSFLSWVFSISSSANVVVDSLPIIGFLYQLGILPWRNDVNDLEALLLFFSISIGTIHFSIRAIRNLDVRDPRVHLWWTGLAGEVISVVVYFYAHGVSIVPVVTGKWTAGVKQFDISKVQIGVETLKCIFIAFSLLDFGRLPGKLWKTFFVKAAQIAFLWIVYEVWNIAKPSSEDEHAIMMIVWTALQKSKALELVVVLRTISILCNWTAYLPPRSQAQPNDRHGSPHPSPVATSVPESIVERQGNSTRRRPASAHVSGSISQPQQQFPLVGIVVHGNEAEEIEVPADDPPELSLGQSAGHGPVPTPIRSYYAAVSRNVAVFFRQLHSRIQ